MPVIESPAPGAAHTVHTLLSCEIYQAWQAAYDDAEQALHAWCAAGYGRKADAYAVYRAAADREDVAAERWLIV